MNKAPEISCQVFIHNILKDCNEIGNYLLAEARIWYPRFCLRAINCWENIEKLYNYLLIRATRHGVDN
jgi:hypothetical protein